MNNIEEKVNNDIDNLIGHSFLKKMNNDNNDNEDKKDIKGIIAKVVCIIVPILILSVYFVIGRDFSNNSYTTAEKQYAVYQLAERAGYAGSYEEWLDEIAGDSIELRTVGTQVQWKHTEASDDAWAPLYDISDYAGTDGLSAYEIWASIEGNYGDEKEFFHSLSAFGIWQSQKENEGKTEEEFLASLEGTDTANAVYKLYQSLGYEGTFEKWEKDYIDGNGEFNFTLIKEEFTVSFVGNGSTKVKDGELITYIPNTPSAEQFYQFDGWYLDDLKWNFKTFVVKGDITLTPQNKLIEYKVDYCLNNDEENHVYNKNTITAVDNMKLYPATKSGYKFLGWTIGDTIDKKDPVEYLNENALETITSGTTIYLFPNFENAEYRVVYELDGGTNNTKNPDTINLGEIKYLYEPSYEGYIFSGWYNQDNEKITMLIDVVNEVTLTARWTTVNYNIIYETNGGTNNTNPYTINSSQEITLTPVVRLGYEFTGWKYEGGSDIVDTISYPTSDTYLVAAWDMLTFNITYEGSGYEIPKDINPDAITYEDPAVTLENISRPGYNFLGWFDENNNRIYELKEVYKDITITAKWEIVVYKITYDLDQGTIIEYNPTVTIYDEEPFILNNPIRSGYEFLGWYYKGETITVLENVSEDMLITAKWSLIEFNVIFETYGAINNVAHVEYINVNSNYILYDIQKAGYTFGGWYTSNDFSTERLYQLTINEAEDENIYLYAKFTWEIYTDNDVQYFYYGSYPQTKVEGISGGVNDKDIIDVAGVKYLYEGGQYFKYEPIKWSIYSSNENTISIVSSKVLDYSVFSEDNISGYANSDIKKLVTEIETMMDNASGELDVENVGLFDEGEISLATFSEKYLDDESTDYATYKKGVDTPPYIIWLENATARNSISGSSYNREKNQLAGVLLKVEAVIN